MKSLSISSLLLTIALFGISCGGGVTGGGTDGKPVRELIIERATLR